MTSSPFGRQAKAAIETLLERGGRLSLELDVQKTDRYGRALAYALLPDGWMVNEEMARNRSGSFSRPPSN